MAAVKALVIDDSKVMRMMVIRALNRINRAEFEFIEAGDGAEGLQVLCSQEVDIAFVDWNMPNLSGIDFVRQARGAGSTIPMVMVTSEKTMAKIEEALTDAGANGYICKPFTEDDMEQKVGKLLDAITNQQAASGGFFSKLFS